jgi:kynurenine formamidase
MFTLLSYPLGPKTPTYANLDINECIFTHPVVLDIPKGDGGLITATDLQNRRETIAQADLLLIHTGWATKYRASDPLRYGQQAPGFAASAFWEHTTIPATATSCSLRTHESNRH